MATNINRTTMSDAIKTVYERRLLSRALPRLIHGRWPEEARISKYGSYEVRKYGSLSAVTTALTDGTTPAEQAAPALSTVTLTPIQYGAWLGFNEIVDMQSYDDLIGESSSILGEQCGLSADTIIRNALTDGATVDYSGGVSARASLDYPQHEIGFADFLRQVAELEAANALPAEGDDFPVVIPPMTWASLMQDETFVNMFIQEAPDSALRSGYVGRILRCKVYVSSNAREYADTGVGSTTDVYSMLFIGKESHAVAGMSSMLPNLGVDGGGDNEYTMTGSEVRPVEIIVMPPGSAGAADPLKQRGTIGWKMSLDIEVLNADWIRTLEHVNVASDD